MFSVYGLLSDRFGESRIKISQDGKGLQCLRRLLCGKGREAELQE